MAFPIVNPDLGTPVDAQYATGGAVESTPPTHPVDLMKVAPLEQNTMLGKFSGDASEAK